MRDYLKQRFDWIYLLYSIFLFGILHTIYPINKSLGLMVMIIVVSYLVGSYLKKEMAIGGIIRIEKYFRKNKILMILLICWISFSIGGMWLFADETAMFSFQMRNGIKFFLLTIWVIPIVLSFLLFLEKHSEKLACRQAKRKDNKKFMILFFAVVFSIHLLYLFAYYPAIVGWDVWDQFSQLQKNTYNDWHPVAHTLYLKVLIGICDTPAVIVLFQIVFFDYFLTLFFGKFQENGISEKILYVIGVFLSLNVFSGMNVVSLWKDSIFTVCIVGISYYFYVYVKDRNNFFQWINLVGFVLCMIGIYTFRHNGSIAVICSSIFFFISGIKNKERLTILSLVLIVMFLVVWKGVIYPIFDITTFPKVKFNPIYHGVASVLKKGGRSVLEGKKFAKEMEEILPYEVWIEKYDPYNWDPLQSVWSFENVELSDALCTYIDAFFYSPEQIVMARLAGSELMWNLFPARNSFERFLDNSQNIIDPNTNEVRYPKISPNFLTKIIETLSEIFNKYQVLLCLTARGGMYFNIILICSLFLIVNRKKEIWSLLPFFGNVISLFLAMAYQDFRYIWFILLLCPIVVMITLLSGT